MSPNVGEQHRGHTREFDDCDQMQYQIQHWHAPICCRLSGVDMSLIAFAKLLCAKAVPPNNSTAENAAVKIMDRMFMFFSLF